ncbi:hypothetical protein QP994_08650 [Corynebacterium sp. MSK044]|uniref:hypothetical protein n=1 Tax=Corynebacterium sp. MSK044 TaxID=3050195 RepID=UPI00254A1505|nr:hypothetical protein [Corynebacterium sp. MSK044]MDK8797947.1 hypothetical protein [Corynebacterium sp. MSK044]
MADKQLTVAELMARAQKENPDIQPRRRRRRSLEEGGISVAELTGSFQAVNARPAEPKHSSAPIDAENTQGDEPQAHASAKPAEAEKPQLKPATSAEQAAEKPNVKVVKVEPTAPTTPTKTPEAEAEPAQPDAAKKAPETPATTDAVPVRQVEVEDQKQKQEAKLAEKPVEKPAADTEETHVIPVVRETPAQAALVAQPKTEPQEAVVAQRAHEDELEDEFEDEADVDEFVDGDLEDEYEYEDDEDIDLEEDASVNPVMLVLMVFGGLLVGVLVFLGFQALWENFNSIVVSVLAVVVTAAIVLTVRSMKTGRDGFTLALAALAGLAMTVGPGLITGF